MNGGRQITSKSVYWYLDELRDFLVDCGWTDMTPASQDDEIGAALGYVLNSNGEDGTRDVWVHLFGGMSQTQTQPDTMPWFSYTTTEITSSSSSVNVDDASDIASSTDFLIVIGTEIIRVANVSSNTLNFSERGVYGTPIGTHSTGGQIAQEAAYAYCEAYVFADWVNPIVSSTGAATCSKTQISSAPGLSGYRSDCFDYESLIKIVDGAEAGKIRRVTAYNESTGTFDVQPFKTAPGSANVGVLSQGFMPAMSSRSGSATLQYRHQGQLPFPGSRQKSFFYADKNGFVALGRMISGRIFGFHAGEPEIAAARDFSALDSAASAGDMSIDVENRNIFTEDQTYRLISQSYADWEPNNTRPSPEPDLDPEDLPNEMIRVVSITPGVGTAGTLQLAMPLTYQYSDSAIVGEFPRPIGRSGFYSTDGIPILFDRDNHWVPCMHHIPYEWIGSNAGRYRRHFWRAIASDSAPWTPNQGSYTNQAMHYAEKRMGPNGTYTNAYGYSNNPCPLTGRYVPGRISISDANSNTTYDLSDMILGLMPYVHWFYGSPGDIPAGSAIMDLFNVPWGNGIEQFRLFGVYSGESESYKRYCLVGPEIDVS